jgi:hypothetical protein
VSLVLPDLDAEPTVGLERALALCGIGRTRGYAALRADQLPFPVIRCGRCVRVPSRALLRLLAAEEEESPRDISRASS